ncbi:hypothetical protein J4U01_gp093 [Mycobacterium phage Kumao]|uniref:Uncharacterized protein n=1 Tax=Mycobacterium phage Kumao TaxID=2041344 RepID=A0A2D1GQ22_9CAUD|nr:hypothetical protein J4U01_gp093 [Mycobacterium phage Kumao]ATN94065.1 hypothetical protein SEA_KUMAO_103 [Mycobacterium phage Kumao]
MDTKLIDALIEAIVAENIKRYEANAAQPYVHEVYQAHEDRIFRLVAALADGDDDLERLFNDALFDITFDGVDWARKVYRDLKAELESARADVVWEDA